MDFVKCLRTTRTKSNIVSDSSYNINFKNKSSTDYFVSVEHKIQYCNDSLELSSQPRLILVRSSLYLLSKELRLFCGILTIQKSEILANNGSLKKSNIHTFICKLWAVDLDCSTGDINTVFTFKHFSFCSPYNTNTTRRYYVTTTNIIQQNIALGASSTEPLVWNDHFRCSTTQKSQNGEF